MTIELPRRSLAKGAAWAIPVVLTAAAAPAYSASLQPCPTNSCIVHYPLSTPTWGTFLAIDGVSSGVVLTMGTFNIDPACAPSGATGYKIDITSVIGIDNTGASHTGSIIAGGSWGPFLLAAAGVAQPSVVFNDYPLDGPAAFDPNWDSNHWLTSYRITYSITYLSGLLLNEPVTAPCSTTTTVTATPYAADYVAGSLTKFS